MAAGKKKPEEKNTDTPGSERSLRDDTEEQLARSPKRSPDLTGQTTEELTHELQVHQIELETQAEELRRAHLALEESLDKFLDLYDFAPIGYLTLTDKALIEEVNLSGATLLRVERSKLVNARFRKFIAPEDFELWDQYFVNLLNRGENSAALSRSNGVTGQRSLPGWNLSGLAAAVGRPRSVLRSVTSPISGRLRRCGRAKSGTAFS
jgi:PAS domain-containing protein